MYPQLSQRLLFLKEYANDVSTLFILEAPYDKELVDNCPCVGNTGKIMSNALFGSTTKIPLGHILNRKVEFIPTNANNYAVFDTFKFPIDPIVAVKLGIPRCNLWMHENLQWSKIKELDRKIGCKLKRMQIEAGHYDRLCHYKTLIQHIQNVDSNVLEKFIENYTKELSQTIMNFRNLKNIVVCGFIAQSIFCFAYDLPYCIIPYRKDFIVSKKRINIRFVNHPINALNKGRYSRWQYTAINKDPIILNTNIKC